MKVRTLERPGTFGMCHPLPSLAQISIIVSMTVAINTRAARTFTLVLLSWNHASMRIYSFKNLVFFFYFDSPCPSMIGPMVLCTVWVRQMHMKRNKGPFLSLAYMRASFGSPDIVAPTGKSHWLFFWKRLMKVKMHSVNNIASTLATSSRWDWINHRSNDVLWWPLGRCV